MSIDDVINLQMVHKLPFLTIFRRLVFIIFDNNVVTGFVTVRCRHWSMEVLGAVCGRKSKLIRSTNSNTSMGIHIYS